jgi:hypothetical protein
MRYRTFIVAGSLLAGALAGAPILRAETLANTVYGQLALTSDTTGSSNSAFGANALQYTLTASANTGVGSAALQHDAIGYYNTAVGAGALQSLYDGHYNTAVGVGALTSNQGGIANTAIGTDSLAQGEEGSYNVAIGMTSMDQASDQGNQNNDNVAVGYRALFFGGTSSTVLGYQALGSNGGYNTIAIGAGAGLNSDSPSNDIYIGSPGPAVAGTSDEGTIRIGVPGVQTQAYLAGVYEATISGGTPVCVNAEEQLGACGTQQSGTAEQLKQQVEQAQQLLVKLETENKVLEQRIKALEAIELPTLRAAAD